MLRIAGCDNLHFRCPDTVPQRCRSWGHSRDIHRMLSTSIWVRQVARHAGSRSSLAVIMSREHHVGFRGGGHAQSRSIPLRALYRRLHRAHQQGKMADTMPTRSLQLPCGMPQILSHRDHKAWKRGGWDADHVQHPLGLQMGVSKNPGALI